MGRGWVNIGEGSFKQRESSKDVHLVPHTERPTPSFHHSITS